PLAAPAEEAKQTDSAREQRQGARDWRTWRVLVIMVRRSRAPHRDARSRISRDVTVAVVCTIADLVVPVQYRSGRNGREIEYSPCRILVAVLNGDQHVGEVEQARKRERAAGASSTGKICTSAERERCLLFKRRLVEGKGNRQGRCADSGVWRRRIISAYIP